MRNIICVLVAASAVLILTSVSFGVKAAPYMSVQKTAVDTGSVSQADVLHRLVLRQLAIQHAMAPIKSRSELKAYLSSHQGDSPLNVLSPLNRKLFLQSLTFGKNGGIGSFNYVVLKQLTPTQIYKILQLFGLQFYTAAVGSTNMQTATDRTLMQTSPQVKVQGRKHYRCVINAQGQKMHTCTPDQPYFCTVNC